jgi:hypothetical protein
VQSRYFKREINFSVAQRKYFTEVAALADKTALAATTIGKTFIGTFIGTIIGIYHSHGFA